MRNINADHPTYIGYAGEKNNTRVSFNLPPDWTSATTSNTIAVFRLPGTTLEVPYSVAVDGGFARWVVDEYAASKSGAGTVYLMTSEKKNGEIRIMKTEPYDTFCKPSGCEHEVTPSMPWLEKMMQLVAYFDGLPDKEANKYLGTDANKNWVWKNGGGGGLTPYEGDYEFTPQKDNEQTGATNNHYMTDNITVHKIPDAEVDNPSGGKTVTIG